MSHQQRMTICKRYLTLASMVVPSALSGAQVRCPQDLQSATAPRAFIIEHRAISMPIGAILLIRRGNDTGALHIISTQEDNLTKPRGDEWTGRVSIKTAYGHNGSGWLQQAKLNARNETLVWGQEKGFGVHYSWQSGNRIANVGPWKFRLSHLTSQVLLSMSTFSGWSGDQEDRGFEFAPTAACSLDELNPSDSRLKWYGFNADLPIPIYLGELPGTTKPQQQKEQ